MTIGHELLSVSELSVSNCNETPIMLGIIELLSHSAKNSGACSNSEISINFYSTRQD